MSRIAIIGRGRLGTALSAALGAAPPLGRGEPVPPGAYAVLLCVPDAQIAHVEVPRGVIVGHTSGATPLSVLGERERFGLHPLMTVPQGAGPEVFAGAAAAVSGSTERAQRLAWELAERAGMRPFALDDDDRAAYHAAASIASNFLVTLESAAERLSGLDRAALAPLVRATVENWVARGDGALTGPIARGDEETVERQREAVEARAPELLGMFDAMVDATRDVAGVRA
jgi:predicted short-subunit dehydrogenase-like oxidoreductase (DUF2520 family)